MRHCLVCLFILLSPFLWATAENSATSPPNTNLPADKPVAPASVPESTNRGQLLYEHHCTSCHTSVAHLREHRKARSRADITVWATKWAVYQKLSWSSDDINVVVDYLDSTFYKFSRSK